MIDVIIFLGYIFIKVLTFNFRLKHNTEQFHPTYRNTIVSLQGQNKKRHQNFIAIWRLYIHEHFCVDRFDLKQVY